MRLPILHTLIVVIILSAQPAHGSVFGQLLQACTLGIVSNPTKQFEQRVAALREHVAEDFGGIQSNQKANPDMRQQIQELRDLMIELSKRNDYHGRGIKCDSNYCHGGTMYLRKVIKDMLGLESTHVTYDPGRWNDAGFEHSFIIIRDFFGPKSPLIIDPTIKQFMARENRGETHDIFVGSAQELYEFVNRYKVARPGEPTAATFLCYMRATEGDRFTDSFKKIDETYQLPFQDN